MSRKHIAFMTQTLQSGGSERVASQLTHLLSDKYDISYIVFDSSDISYEIDAELIDLDVPPSDNKFRKAVNLARRAAGIRRAVKKNHIDLLMSFTSIANLAMRFAHPGCRTIGACRGYGDLARNPEKYRKVVKSGAELLFNSVEMQDHYLSLYPDDRARCSTIENLIDFENDVSMAADPLPPAHAEFYATHSVVSTVGIFSRHKGHWDLLKSFELLREKVPDAGLVIVGHRGLLEKNIAEMAGRNRFAGDILLTGYQSNPFKYVAKSKVFAFSSISEGFPNALIEAMACGVPCVSTACPAGPREIMFNEYTPCSPAGEYVIAPNGILTPEFDGIIDYDYAHLSDAHRIFAGALEKLLTDRKTAKGLAEAGIERARRNDVHVIADRYFRLIEGER